MDVPLHNLLIQTMTFVFNILIAAKLYNFIALDMKNASFRKLQIAKPFYRISTYKRWSKATEESKCSLFTLNIKIGFFN